MSDLFGSSMDEDIAFLKRVIEHSNPTVPGYDPVMAAAIRVLLRLADTQRIEDIPIPNAFHWTQENLRKPAPDWLQEAIDEPDQANQRAVYFSQEEWWIEMPSIGKYVLREGDWLVRTADGRVLPAQFNLAEKR